jgi:hypothetical protein
VLATSSRFGRVRTAALVSTALVLPLLILELRNGASEFPPVLFALLWLLPFAFVLFFQGTVGSGARAGTLSYLRRPLAAACLVFIAWFWITVVVDQMPCFLGVPNCD